MNYEEKTKKRMAKCGLRILSANISAFKIVIYRRMICKYGRLKKLFLTKVRQILLAQKIKTCTLLIELPYLDNLYKLLTQKKCPAISECFSCISSIPNNFRPMCFKNVKNILKNIKVVLV